jgi:hypothetical protein
MEAAEHQDLCHYKSLFGLPRPRRVRIRAGSLIILGALPLASLFLVYAGVQKIRASQAMGMQLSARDSVILEFVLPTILFAISGVTFWEVHRDKALLSNGELALGVVTHQNLVEARGSRGGSRTQSRVRYRFKDASGELFQGTGTDSSRKLRVDMTVPVFYEREDPSKNVSIYTAICELKAD